MCWFPYQIASNSNRILADSFSCASLDLKQFQIFLTVYCFDFVCAIHCLRKIINQNHNPFCRLDNKSAGRQSVGSNLIKPDDEVDDADSMAAYGEGDTGESRSLYSIYFLAFISYLLFIYLSFHCLFDFLSR